MSRSDDRNIRTETRAERECWSEEAHSLAARRLNDDAPRARTAWIVSLVVMVAVGLAVLRASIWLRWDLHPLKVTRAP